jgi:hypothetical protein
MPSAAAESLEEQWQGMRVPNAKRIGALEFQNAQEEAAIDV